MLLSARPRSVVVSQTRRRCVTERLSGILPDAPGFTDALRLVEDDTAALRFSLGTAAAPPYHDYGVSGLIPTRHIPFAQTVSARQFPRRRIFSSSEAHLGKRVAGSDRLHIELHFRTGMNLLVELQLDY